MAAALLPGWWWIDVNSAEAPAFYDLLNKNPAVLQVRKTFRAPAAATEIVIFEVLGGPFVWPLSRWPEQAPKKLATTPEDIAQAQNPSSSLRVAIEELLGKPFDTVRKTTDSAVTAVKVLVWGGVGILLWNLWDRTRAREIEDA